MADPDMSNSESVVDMAALAMPVSAMAARPGVNNCVTSTGNA